MSGANLAIPGVVGATEIGRGGFGVVFRATEEELGREVAVKVLTGDLDDRTKTRFERERRAMGALSSHPNIITIFRSGIADDGSLYLVMEYLPGGSLAERVAGDGPSAWQDTLRIGIELSGALESAHRAGVLHRDVKPGNIMVDNLGRTKLGDFGIARLDGSPETKSAVITASVAHAPPEVIGGGKPDERSDVYSLASTLFEVASGAPAFVRATDESMIPMFARIVHDPTPDLRQRGVPDRLAAVLERAMAKNADDRFGSAGEFGQALIEVQRQLGLSETKLWIAGEPQSGGDRGVNQSTTVVPPPVTGAPGPPPNTGPGPSTGAPTGPSNPQTPQPALPPTPVADHRPPPPGGHPAPPAVNIPAPPPAGNPALPPAGNQPSGPTATPPQAPQQYPGQYQEPHPQPTPGQYQAPGSVPAPPSPGFDSPGYDSPGQYPPPGQPSHQTQPSHHQPSPQPPAQPAPQSFTADSTGPVGYGPPPGPGGGPQVQGYVSQPPSSGGSGGKGLLVGLGIGLVALLAGVGIWAATNAGNDDDQPLTVSGNGDQTDSSDSQDGDSNGSNSDGSDSDGSDSGSDSNGSDSQDDSDQQDTTTTTVETTTTTAAVNAPRLPVLADLPSLPALQQPYVDYRTVTDRNSSFTFQVPVEWVDDLAIEGQVISSPDNNAALNDEAISGVVVSGTQGNGVWDPDAFLDAVLLELANPDAPCDQLKREPFVDGPFDGLIYAESCGGGQLLVVDVIVASPARDAIIFIAVQMTDERDFAAFEEVLESFLLNDANLLPAG